MLLYFFTEGVVMINKGRNHQRKKPRIMGHVQRWLFSTKIEKALEVPKLKDRRYQTKSWLFSTKVEDAWKYRGRQSCSQRETVQNRLDPSSEVLNGFAREYRAYNGTQRAEAN